MSNDGQLTVQEKFRRACLAESYLQEAYKIDESDPTNAIGMAFWILMSEYTEIYG
jgi:hypothetical protein